MSTDRIATVPASAGKHGEATPNVADAVTYLRLALEALDGRMTPAAWLELGKLRAERTAVEARIGQLLADLVQANGALATERAERHLCDRCAEVLASAEPGILVPLTATELADLDEPQPDGPLTLTVADVNDPPGDWLHLLVEVTFNPASGWTLDPQRLVMQSPDGGYCSIHPDNLLAVLRHLLVGRADRAGSAYRITNVDLYPAAWEQARS